MRAANTFHTVLWGVEGDTITEGKKSIYRYSLPTPVNVLPGRVSNTITGVGTVVETHTGARKRISLSTQCLIDIRRIKGNIGSSLAPPVSSDYPKCAE